jgi:hypothetical protein
MLASAVRTKRQSGRMVPMVLTLHTVRMQTGQAAPNLD